MWITSYTYIQHKFTEPPQKGHAERETRQLFPSIDQQVMKCFGQYCCHYPHLHPLLNTHIHQTVQKAMEYLLSHLTGNCAFLPDPAEASTLNGYCESATMFGTTVQTHWLNHRNSINTWHNHSFMQSMEASGNVDIVSRPPSHLQWNGNQRYICYSVLSEWISMGRLCTTAWSYYEVESSAVTATFN